MTGAAMAIGIANIVTSARNRRSRPVAGWSTRRGAVGGRIVVDRGALLHERANAAVRRYSRDRRPSRTRTVVRRCDRTYGYRGLDGPNSASLWYARGMTARAPSSTRSGHDHVVTQDPGAPAVLAVDLHLVHEVTSPQAFSGLRARGIGVRRPGQTVATADHSIPTTDRSLPFIDPMALAQVNQLEANCAEFGIPLHGIGDPGQGIVHVIGPAARADPARDDHRVRRLAHEHPRRVRGARVRDRDERGRDGPRHPDASSSATRRPTRSGSTAGSTPGVSAKDIILALIARIGIGGGTGHVFEYTGEAIRGADHGAADDRLQHEHRGRRAGRADRPGRHDLRVPARPDARPDRAGLGRGRGGAGARCRPTTARPTTRRSRSTPTASSRWSPTAPTPGWASRSPAASPRRPTRRIPASAARSSARSSTWTSSPARRSSARRSTSSSSAAAPTAGSATCGSRRACSRVATSPTASG